MLQFFDRPDALSVPKPSVSKHRKKITCIILKLKVIALKQQHSLQLSLQNAAVAAEMVAAPVTLCIHPVNVMPYNFSTSIH